MIRRLLLAICLFAAVPVTGWTQTLRIVLREDPDLLDPTFARSFSGRIVFAGLCDKLFDISPALDIVPQLAINHEWTDPVTLLIRLRPGVTFHNGEAVDAEAVKYTLERNLARPGSLRRSEIDAIDHVDVVDDLTAKIVLKSPMAPLLAYLADRAGMILPPKATAALGADFHRAPVCSGPFRFIDRIAGERILLDRYPRYWDARNVHFEHVIYWPMPDAASLLAGLHEGKIDLAEGLLPSYVNGLSEDPGLHITISPSLGFERIVFNTGHGDRARTPLGQNKLLRQAFEAAIDRRQLNQSVFKGLNKPTAQPFSELSAYYVNDLPVPPRDLDKAKALVRESGVPVPVVVRMTVPDRSDRVQEAHAIQAMVKEAGFDVTIDVVPLTAALKALTAGDFEAGLMGWSGRADPDASLFPFLATGASQNDGGYSDPALDAALKAAGETVVVPLRRGFYRTALTRLRDGMPTIYLFAPVNIVASSAKLTGFVPMPDGVIRLQGLALAP